MAHVINEILKISEQGWNPAFIFSSDPLILFFFLKYMKGLFLFVSQLLYERI